MSTQLPKFDQKGRIRIYTNDPRDALVDVERPYEDAVAMENLVANQQTIRIRVGRELVTIFPNHITAISFTETKENN